MQPSTPQLRKKIRSLLTKNGNPRENVKWKHNSKVRPLTEERKIKLMRILENWKVGNELRNRGKGKI